MLVLYNPPSSASRKPVLPMSLLSLGALLEERVDYAIVDGNLETDPLAAIGRRLSGGDADVVAVTVMPGPQLAAAVPLCRALKQRHPHVRIVWGGYFPSQHYEVCLDDPAVDVVVRGHGEMAFAPLVNRLQAGAAFDDLEGLAYRDAGGSVVDRGLATMPHPQDLPDFPYHRVDMARYARRTFLGARTLSHHSSYGCPFVCNFCAVVNLAKGRWLSQSAPRTAAVVERLVREFGADSVEFYDNNFFVDERRIVEFAERIAPLGIGWWGEARIDTMLRFAPDTWALMRRSGLRMVFLGAESGSSETLRRMDKGGTLTPEKTLEFVARAAQYDIVPELSFIIGNPPDPEADVRGTLAFIRRVKRANPHTEVIFYLYSPVPLAGDLYDKAQASGFRFPTTLDGWIDPGWLGFAQRRGQGLFWVRDRVQRAVHDFERVLHARFPTVTDPRLVGVRRWLPQLASAWRYRFGVYGLPLELRLLDRLMPYVRPETAGF